MHEVIERLLSHLRGIWLRRWYALSAAWVIALAGWFLVFTLPQRYEATARVYIDTQSILKPLMSGLAVNTPVEQQVQVMTRTLLNRPNMEKVARMADMDIKAKSNKEMELLINDLISHVQLEMANRGQDNLYRITYQNSNPDLAKKVVQSLLTILVEGSLGNKRKDTDTARRFIEDQLKTYGEKLTDSENALKDFKQRHIGLMPGQGGDYFTKLAESQRNLNDATLSLREAETRRNELRRQVAGENPDAGLEPQATIAANPDLDARIQGLQKNLDQLRLSYTEQHPDIVNAKRLIAQLEEQKKQEAKLRKPTSASSANQNPYYQQLNLALAESEAQVASIRARVNEFSARYHELRQQAARVPQVEAEYLQLTRDYEVNKRNYEELLSRRDSAQISEEMEAKTEVIDFKVIDPPYVPAKPAFPNRPVLLSVVLLVAMLGGAASAFVINQMRPIIMDRNGVAEVSPYPILGSVTMIWNHAQKEAQRKRLMIWGAGSSALVSAYALLMGLVLLMTRNA